MGGFLDLQISYRTAIPSLNPGGALEEHGLFIYFLRVSEWGIKKKEKKKNSVGEPKPRRHLRR